MASSAQYDQGQAGGGGGGGAAGQPRPLQMGAKGAYIVRLLMVGDSSCGKTSLVLRFDQNVFSTKFVTTIGVDYRDKMVKVRQTQLDLIRFFCFGKLLLLSCLIFASLTRSVIFHHLNNTINYDKKNYNYNYNK